MITRAGTLAPVNYPGYPPELESQDNEDNEEDVFTMLQSRVHCLLDVNHIINSIISKRSLELIKAEMKMCLNTLKR